MKTYLISKFIHTNNRTTKKLCETDVVNISPGLSSSYSGGCHEIPGSGVIDLGIQQDDAKVKRKLQLHLTEPELIKLKAATEHALAWFQTERAAESVKNKFHNDLAK